MLRARMILVAVACALGATIAVPAAFGATPQQIYGDYARDGRLDQRYSAPDLRRALGDATLQGYPRVGFKGAVEQALGAQAVKRSGGLPFTGLDLALIGAGGALLLVSGTTLVRLGRARK